MVSRANGHGPAATNSNGPTVPLSNGPVATDSNGPVAAPRNGATMTHSGAAVPATATTPPAHFLHTRGRRGY